MRDESRYDNAQICLNGHIITDSAISYPQHCQDFCNKCGTATTRICVHCNAAIRGRYIVSGIYGGDSIAISAFCYKCGKPYHWTEAKFRVAQDLSEEVEGLNSQEKEILKKSLDDIVRDTPQTGVAALKFKKLVAKSGKVAAEGFKDIVIDIIRYNGNQLHPVLNLLVTYKTEVQYGNDRSRCTFKDNNVLSA